MEPFDCIRHKDGECLAPSNPQPETSYYRARRNVSGRRSVCRTCSVQDSRRDRASRVEIIEFDGMRWLTIEAHRKLERSA